MRYLALALDYDGTAASDGKLSDAASSAHRAFAHLGTARRAGDWPARG